MVGAARLTTLVVGIGLVAAACGASGQSGPVAAEPAVSVSPTVTVEPEVVIDGVDPTTGIFTDRALVYNPVEAGEELPDGFRQLLARDAIAPVYQPRFVAADSVAWGETNLVIGVDLEGEARAYPVGFLTRREMVIDNHRGIPTLVTW